MLTPDDHREAFASADPSVRARLGSVGRPLPSLEVEVRGPGPDEAVLPAGEKGEIWVRGEQVAGEYVGRSVLDEEGWFRTRDAGWFDAHGFLYIEGRLDDVIVRGAENISPGEIEEVLMAHPAVAEAAVIGIPDAEWGEAVAAVVVLRPGGPGTTEAELQDWVRGRLRSTKTPGRGGVPGRAALLADGEAAAPGVARRAGGGGGRRGRRGRELIAPQRCPSPSGAGAA